MLIYICTYLISLMIRANFLLKFFS